MNIRPLLLALLTFGLALGAAAADDAKTEPPKKQATKAEIEARLAAHHLKKEAQAAADKAAAATAKADAAATAAPVTTPGGPAAPATAAEEPAQVLPKVEVKNNRVTELDVQLAKQNQEISREKQNTKPTKLDETLNGPKISAALAIFGGQSSEDRSNVAKERVAMMEDERDIIEAISQATTKEEKAELEQLLASMKATRRELESSLK